MKLRLLMLAVCSLTIFNFAEAKEKAREPASRTKKVRPPLVCSNAMGDGGFTVTIYNGNRASIMENNIAGATHVANIKCSTSRDSKPAAPDALYTLANCSGKGLNDSPKQYSITVSAGGFAGFTDADLTIDGEEVAMNMPCK